MRIDSSAPDFDADKSHTANHAVVIDDHEPLVQIIAANYAYSIGADLVLIPQRDDDLRDEIYQEIDAQRSFRGEERGTRAMIRLTRLRDELAPSLHFGNRDFVTFVTSGIPYGYFYRNAPSTHLLASACLGESINAAIRWAWRDEFAHAAVLIDPGHFVTSETAAVAASLKGDGISVFEVLGKNADVENVEMFFRRFPFDLLFICSHCGEVSGRRVTIEVADTSGTRHAADIDEVFAFGTTRFGDNPNKNARVHHFMSFVGIDGLDWFSTDEDVRVTVLDYLRDTPRESWQVIAQQEVNRVRHSTAIKLSDFPLMLNLQNTFNPQVSPIIFNNSCVSFYGAALTLMYAGARAYVGTLTPVNSSAAQQLAERIFVDSDRSLSLPLALHNAQLQAFGDPDDRVYVHVGCHFESLRASPHASGPIVRRRIDSSIADWKSCYGDANPMQQENIREAIRFLSTF